MPPLGAAGGFCDAVGGGGWGPVVTSCLMGAGHQPRYVVGTVNAAEFVVTLAIVSAFVIGPPTGHWEEAGGILPITPAAVAGLIVGGMLAAPIAGLAARLAPPRALGGAVGALILSLSLYQTWSWWADPPYCAPADPPPVRVGLSAARRGSSSSPGSNRPSTLPRHALRGSRPG